MKKTYKRGMYHVGHTTYWGNYCPETGEYYLALASAREMPGVNGTSNLPICAGVLASAREMPDGEWQVQSASGYSYEVVRELLQLGHLTPKTLEQFLLEEGGEVWWNQPNYSKEV